MDCALSVDEDVGQHVSGSGGVDIAERNWEWIV